MQRTINSTYFSTNDCINAGTTHLHAEQPPKPGVPFCRAKNCGTPQTNPKTPPHLWCLAREGAGARDGDRPRRRRGGLRCLHALRWPFATRHCGGRSLVAVAVSQIGACGQLSRSAATVPHDGSAQQCLRRCSELAPNSAFVMTACIEILTADATLMPCAVSLIAELELGAMKRTINSGHDGDHPASAVVTHRSTTAFTRLDERPVAMHRCRGTVACMFAGGS